MKNKILNILLIAFVTLNLSSCLEEGEVQFASIAVSVDYSDDFRVLTPDGLTVTLTNVEDAASITLETDAEGVAHFENIAPGKYSVSCSRNLSREEIVEVNGGGYDELSLNAVKDDIIVGIGGFGFAKLTLDGRPSSKLIIKQIYNEGANDPNYSVLFKDQFFEIYNNSDETVYADGLYFASICPQRNGSDSDDEISTLDFTEFIYAEKIVQVPGNGTENPIAPGESIVICFNAVDWTEDGAKADITVDNSTADFEMYAIDWLESQGRTGNPWMDVDNVDVPNMECIYMGMENYGQFTYMSTSLAIFRDADFTIETITDPESSQSDPLYYAKIKTETVLDAVEVLFDAESGVYKRLPTFLDASFTFTGTSGYSSNGLIRKTKSVLPDGRVILQDSNNSANDFEVVNPPIPRGFLD